jgi:hypothetical protein
VPIATERSAAKSHCLFGHLVGAAEQRKWDYRYIPLRQNQPKKEE